MNISPSTTAAPPRYAFRIWIFFAGYFLFGGVSVPFYPVWLQAQGLTEVQIANVIALPAVVRVLLTPLAGIFADRAPNRRFAAICFTLPAIFVFLLAWPLRGYWPLLLITAASFTLWGLALPVGEALALTGVRRFGLDYGRMRIGGSVAYIIANLGSGALLGIFHVEALFWFLIVAMGSSALVSATLPVTPKEVRALDDASRPPPPRAREILGHPGFFALVIAGGLIQASHAMLYGFGSIHWHGLGFSGLEIGIFWSTGVVCEITLFMVSTRAVRIAGPLGLVTLGGFVAILRWGLFATDPGFAGVMALMALHAFTFGATYAGNQHAIARLVPEEMTASAQAIYGSTSAILMAGATALAGPLYEAFGAHAFLAMIVPAAIGLAIIAALVRFSPRGRALRA
ncbi:MAG: MFS transporter [Rhizobiales bacterium]|jgi:PPP family 3-phenylpropionic acid transporter|nr:MFS transporter [Hyphomicrobiales bacterium]